MARRINKVQAAMDTCILDISVAHGRQFFAQICTVLVFDVLNYGIPTVYPIEKRLIIKGNRDLPSLVVDLVAITRGINNVESKSDAILNDDYIKYMSVNIDSFL